MAPITAEQHQMFARNRALRARQGRWPPGRLKAIEALEKRHPGWLVSWRDGGTWYARSLKLFDYVPYEHPASYLADNGDIVVCGRTLPELAEALKVARPRYSQWYKSICCGLLTGR
jgi:hypothetical protein